MIPCKKCHKEFKPTRPWSLFCSPGCRFQHYNETTRKAVKDARDGLHASTRIPDGPPKALAFVVLLVPNLLLWW